MAKRTTKKAAPQQSMVAGMASGLMDKLRELDDQRRSIMDGAMAEAMNAANAAIAALNSLGHSYQLVKGPVKRKTRSGGGVATRKVADRPCPVCGFKTNPPHDARAHRSQKDKKPFTATELQAKGLSKS